MEIDLIELKGQARAAMDQADPSFRAVTLVYILMTTGVAFLLSLIPVPADPETGLSFVSLFLTILYNLYAAAAGFGFTLWGLWTIRRLNPGMSSLTQGFSVAGRVVCMRVMIILREICFVMTLGFALAFLGVVFLPVLWFYAPLAAIMGTYLILFAGLWWFSLRYALAPYLLADHPDDGPSLPVRRSVMMMRGWKKELFQLELSFLGWHLLILALQLVVWGVALWQAGVLDMGAPVTVEEVSMMVVYCESVISHPLTVLACTVVTLPVQLWLMPYRGTTLAGFYDTRLLAPQYPEQPMMPPV